MEEALIKRVMPNSLEAEQSVIGSMIMDKDAIVAAGEILIAEDFYHKQYGILFDAMQELFNAAQPVDLITLQNKLKEKDYKIVRDVKDWEDLEKLRNKEGKIKFLSFCPSRYGIDWEK